jgi:uncharacterized RDD family membrane protein YckC
MECRFCRAWNEEDERRCVRCGRRMHAPASRPVSAAYPLMTATAPSLGADQPIENARGEKTLEGLEALPGGRPAHDPASPDPSAPPLRYQPSLFRDPGPGPKVIPLPTLTPVRSPGSQKRVVARSPLPRTGRRGSDSQQSLDFSDVRRAFDPQVEAVIYCDAPVAVPVHRLIAAAVDASMILISLSLFLGIFLLSGGHLVFSKQVVPVFLGVAGVLWLLYHMLWCLADGDTPGMRFAGLRVVNFDGRIPDRDERGVRQAAYVLSVLSAGVGLLWALVDEENLAWHDHISKTFPTPG